MALAICNESSSDDSCRTEQQRHKDFQYIFSLMGVKRSCAHIHNLSVSLPQTPSLTHRRRLSAAPHISYKLSASALPVEEECSLSKCCIIA